ncbi:MAG: aminotransferase class IV [Bacteroidetes bacterium]|nr:aminotransferase class IV [Bacteroidota bacterium]
MLFLEQSGTQDSTRPFDLRDRGLLLGHGVFDTSLIIRGHMILRTAHINRLVGDAAALGINISHQRINDITDTFLNEDHHGILRITITSGPAGRWNLDSPDIPPTILVNFSPPTINPLSPLSLHVSSIRRNNTSITSRHKTLAYTDNIVALKAARVDGYGDAIFLNSSNNVCCVTTANLFLKFGDCWVTPPISDGVLPGVMRHWIMHTGPTLGLQITERSINEKELQNVESAFITNSVRLATPVSEINDRKLHAELPPEIINAITNLIKGM